jgi:hypothetical protein
MSRSYGTTRAAPYASAPPIGLVGDTYWDTTAKSLYVSDGAVWNAVGGGASLWSVSGLALTPTDPSKQLSLPAAGALHILLGGATMRTRMGDLGGAFILCMNGQPASSLIDDQTKPAWSLALQTSPDTFRVLRAPPAATAAYTPLLTVNGDGSAVLPGPTASGADQSTLRFGTRTQKGRLHALPGIDWIGFGSNQYYNGSAWVQDDTAQPSWRSYFYLDSFNVDRTPAGGGAGTAMLLVTSGGNATMPGVVQGTSGVRAGAAGVGYAYMNPGSAANTGYLSWYNASNQRCGYFGFGNGTRMAMVCNENGYTGVDIAGTIGGAFASGSANAVARTNIVPSHAIFNYGGPVAVPNVSVGTNVWVNLAQVSGLNTRGGPVLCVANTGYETFYGGSTAYRYYCSIWRDGGAVGTNSPTVGASAMNPVGTVVAWDWPAAGSHTYACMVYNTGPALAGPADWQGQIWAIELS